MLLFRANSLAIRQRGCSFLIGVVTATSLVFHSKLPFSSDSTGEASTSTTEDSAEEHASTEGLDFVQPRFDAKQGHRQAKRYFDEPSSRCLACGEQIASWSGHLGFVPHQARVAVAERVISGQCGPVSEVLQHWWSLLSAKSLDDRIPALSHETDSEERRLRLVHLLKFLRDQGVLKAVFSFVAHDGFVVGRNDAFERFEMIGDNIVKYMFLERFHHCFPDSEGGLSGQLVFLQQAIDSNEGLLKIYDYFNFDSMLGVRLAASKFKSDVIEALFGELQVYLWATQCEWDVVHYDLPNTPDTHYLRAVTAHVLEELSHVCLTSVLEHVVKSSWDVLVRDAKSTTKPVPHDKYSIRPYVEGHCYPHAASFPSAALHINSKINMQLSRHCEQRRRWLSVQQPISWLRVENAGVVGCASPRRSEQRRHESSRQGGHATDHVECTDETGLLLTQVTPAITKTLRLRMGLHRPPAVIDIAGMLPELLTSRASACSFGYHPSFRCPCIDDCAQAPTAAEAVSAFYLPISPVVCVRASSPTLFVGELVEIGLDEKS